MSRPQQDVIDLTEDTSPVHPQRRPSPDVASSPISRRATRPLRFPRDIIDLEDQEDAIDTGGVREASPDIEFLSSRSLPPTARPRSRSLGLAGRTHVRRPPQPGQATEDPVSSHPRPLSGVWADLTNQVRRAHQSLNHPTRGPQRPSTRPDQGMAGQETRISLRHTHEELELDRIFMGAGRDMILPGNLDFSIQGFPMGDVQQPQPPPPTYDAPLSPRPGFTRSPREVDYLVCPNCDEELGMGKDDCKKQVWVVKSCGHVCCTVHDLSGSTL